MSSPSFLLANESNHSLLHSLLEALNAIIEHQYPGKCTACYFIYYRTDKSTANPNLIYAILRSRKRFQALTDFTLESAQDEIERQNQLRKERRASDGGTSTRGNSRQNSMDSLRSPISSRPPTLSNVPEENSAFSIGDDDDSGDEEDNRTPQRRSPMQSGSNSRTASISSAADESVPLQLRGMSEKARGKMPVGAPSFSRQNSTSSLSSLATPTVMPNGTFNPTTEWVSVTSF